MSSRRTLSLVALVVLAFGLGAIPLIVREDIPWQSLVASRVWLGALTLIVLMAATRQLRIPATHRVEIVLGGILLAVHWATFFWAIKNTTVAVALAVVFLGPVSASVLAPRFLGDVVPRRIYWALGTSFFGVVLVVVRQGADESTSGFEIEGVLAALVSAAAIAALMLITKAAVDTVGALPVATGELVVAAIVLSPWLPGAVSETVANPLPLLTLGIVLTGLSFLIIWTAIREHSVAVVSVLLHIEPASAVVLALVFLSEVPDGWQWLGIGLVLAGGLMAARDATTGEVLHAPANL
ncbi:MAG: EamA family transporter [Acidimicrobiia bacterium]|nr:EamA family transporter [Acidimicrobiia bacterium]MDX2468354.1 EamA family transporter [Acidimicrobiia bacterium]